MVSVRIIRDYDWPDLMRQTPDGMGIWDGIQFREDACGPADYIIVTGTIRKTEQVYCDPTRIWLLTHEPPNEIFWRHHLGPKCVHMVLTSDERLKGSRYRHCHPALPWHVNYNYDWLKDARVPAKTANLSWITSSKSNFEGHRTRMGFLNAIRTKINFHLYGYGFQPLQNKWDGLAPYRYSLAVENFSNPYYWSEKIADCFLSWTMPIYYGCTRIADYFPKESFVQIDIKAPERALEIIRETISSDRWMRHRDAIHEARHRVLEKHQLFPFLSRKIQEWENSHPRHSPRDLELSPRYRCHDTVRFSAIDFIQKPYQKLRNKISKYLHPKGPLA